MDASAWLRSFTVESGRSKMWQSPMYPLTLHLVQVTGCFVLGLGLILLMSVSFGSTKRFTEGCCVLGAMAAVLYGVRPLAMAVGGEC